MPKSAYLSLAIILCIVFLTGGRMWLEHQEAARVQARADAQWEEVMELYKIVHVTGIETIEAQVLRTDLTPKYRQFLADNLPSWQLYLEARVPDVDMLVDDLIVDATTPEEVRRRDQRLSELTSEVMMPWMRLAHYFPDEKVARP